MITQSYPTVKGGIYIKYKSISTFDIPSVRGSGAVTDQAQAGPAEGGKRPLSCTIKSINCIHCYFHFIRIISKFGPDRQRHPKRWQRAVLASPETMDEAITVAV